MEDHMPFPVEITFHRMQPSAAIESRIREKAAKLERFYDRIMHCHVVVEAPHSHHHKGKLYHVSITIKVPQSQVVVNRDQHDNHAHEDLFVVIRDSFAAAQRKLEDFSRQQRGQIKSHEAPPSGWVTRLVAEEDYGNIETVDGRLIYFHRNSVLGGGFDELEIGAPVSFLEEQGEEGPQASTVRLLTGVIAA
jgi:ribosome-associated translation inhibitor RaiA/cold shock CspA family protein